MSFLGVDVGGTKVSVAALEDGRLGEPDVTPTDTSSARALVDQLAARIEAARTPRTRAVGLGIPSAIEYATGTAKSGVNVPLEGVPLRRILSGRLGLPVFVDNDANVAALAEAHEDGRLAVRHLVMFTVGTGVGGGLVLDGRVFRGATGAGAEMGHVLVGLDLEHGAPPASERFPQPGSLEALAAGTELDRLATAAARRNPGGALGRAAAAAARSDPGDARARSATAEASVTGVDVVREARAGDEESIELLRILGERLGIGIAGAINVFDPEEVVVGGGVATAGDLLLEPARAVARDYVLAGVGERTTIRLARHGVRSGVYGAALLAAQEANEEG